LAPRAGVGRAGRLRSSYEVLRREGWVRPGGGEGARLVARASARRGRSSAPRCYPVHRCTAASSRVSQEAARAILPRLLSSPRRTLLGVRGARSDVLPAARLELGHAEVAETGLWSLPATIGISCPGGLHIPRTPPPPAAARRPPPEPRSVRQQCRWRRRPNGQRNTF
jgi:hypothetical protein